MKRFDVTLPVETYREWMAMKGELGHSAAVERLILEKKRRRERKMRREAA